MHFSILYRNFVRGFISVTHLLIPTKADSDKTLDLIQQQAKQTNTPLDDAITRLVYQRVAGTLFAMVLWAGALVFAMVNIDEINWVTALPLLIMALLTIALTMHYEKMEKTDNGTM